jgi:hypothetical protein
VGRADYFKPRDYNRICDRCGCKVKASETVKERGGFIVCRDCHDARHRAVAARGQGERQRVPEPRPDGEPVFVGPGDITAEGL